MKYSSLFILVFFVLISCKRNEQKIYKPIPEGQYVSPAEAENQAKVIASFESYHNKRFNFCVNYPADFLPQGVSQNGDGQSILNPDGDLKITVWGTLLGRASLDGIDENSIEKEYNFELQMSPNVSYHKKARGWYVVSGNDAGKIYYKKGFLTADKEFVFLLLEYPEGQAKAFNTLVGQIAGPFPACN